MTAIIERTGFEVDAIDVFCGFGGSSQGIHAAGATVRAAANHNELALECHAANYPDVDHWQADMVDANNPRVVNRAGKMVPGRYLDPKDLPAARFAWFSPGCQDHSQANAKKVYDRGRQMVMFEEDDFDQAAYANSERSRVTMSCVLRYVAHRTPEILVVENVIEVTQWGPGRDGTTFAWWLAELKNLGYDTEICYFNSMFFPPTPQSRDRIYIVAWRKGNRKPDLDYRPTAYCTSDMCGGVIVQAVQTWKPRQRSWPLAKWGKYGSQYTYTCGACHSRVYPAAFPAYSAINWANLGPTIAERDRPLAPATMERIRRGLAKFRNGPPIIIPAKAVWGVDRPVTMPLQSQTTQQDKALVVGGCTVDTGQTHSAAHKAHNRAHGLHEATPTMQAGRATLGFVADFAGHAILPSGHTNDSTRQVIDPHFTVVAGGRHNCLATEGIVLPTAGNVSEREGQTRARALTEQLFTQHTTMAFGFAHVPFLAEMRGGGSHHSGQHPVTSPMHSVTAGGMHHGLASPALFEKINGGPGDTAWHHMGEPLNTICAKDTTGLVVLPWVDQWMSDPVAVTEQLATVMTHLRHALASVDVDTIPVTDADLDRVRFRMLEPDPELRAAMAFGADYILLGNKTQMTSGLGNAVTPPVAGWITERCLATLRG